MLKVGLVGITGKMGQKVLSLLNEDSECNCVCGISSGQADYNKLAGNSDVVIDFSQPRATLKAAEICSKFKKPLVTGTTGISDMSQLQSAALSTPILHASNFCISIHLLASFLKNACKMLSDFEIDIIETHHKSKKDAPSGTALFLKNSIPDRDDIEIISRRHGNCIGEHTVSLFGKDEVLTLKHEAFGRDIFARGAISVAKWIVHQKPGFYNMQDYICSLQKI